MFRKILFFLFILPSIAFAQIPPTGIQDEGGSVSRPVFVLNCVGDGVECTHSGITGTITVSTAGGGIANPMTSDLDTNGFMIESQTRGLLFDPDDDGTAEVVFKSDGNVGIGVVNPTALLSVSGGKAFITNNGSDVLAVTGTGTSGSVLKIYSNYGQMQTGFSSPGGTLGYLRTTTNGTTAMSFGIKIADDDAFRINTDLNVGIGSTNPDAKLVVDGDVHLMDNPAPSDTENRLYNVSGSLFWDGASITAGAFANPMTADLDTNGFMLESNTIGIQFDVDDDGTADHILTSAGNVGIGDLTPRGLLEVGAGDVFIGTGTFDNPSGSSDVYVTGNLEVDGTVYGGTAQLGGATNNLTIDGSGNADFNGSMTHIGGWLSSPTSIVPDLAAADDNYSLGTKSYARTIVSVGCRCIGTCSTMAQISLEDRGGNAMTHTTPTCATTGAVTYQSVTAGGSLTAGEGLAFDVDNTPSPETDTYEILWTETRD